MKKRLMIGGAVLSVALLAGGWGVVASGGSGDPNEDLQDLEFWRTSIKSESSTTMFTADIRTSGEKLGTAQTVCSSVGPAEFSVCTTIAHLPRGAVILNGTGGPGTQGTTQTFAITGGTGAYKTARGEVTLRYPNPDPTVFEADFHIVE